jgi:hypothetical protein
MNYDSNGLSENQDDVTNSWLKVYFIKDIKHLKWYASNKKTSLNF